LSNQSCCATLESSEMATGGTLYQVLQVDPAAEAPIIEAAYRRLAKMYHPDVAASPDAATRMKKINAA